MFIFLAFVFIFISCWAFIQPYNASPDEEMRFQIVEYIVNHWTLPDGRDPEIMNPIWGLSYGYYPMLAYMIMAVPAKIASLFSNCGFETILMTARIVNAVFGTVTAYFTFRISELLFKSRAKYLFTALVVFMPMSVFIHSYVNNDSLALMSVAWIIFVCASSIKNGWTWKLCVSYAVGVSVCLLSYYNAYGIILCSMIFFFATVLIGYTRDKKAKYIASRTLAIVLIVFALAAWWFIRNAILYDGDFLGLDASSKSAEIHASEGFKPSERITLSEQGYDPFSLLGYSQWAEGKWINMVAVSFVGVFGQMDIFMPGYISKGFFVIFIAGFIGCITCLVKLFRVHVRADGKMRGKKQQYLTGACC